MSFQTIRKGPLEYLVSTLIETPHCFSTRYGGVSSGYLGSLNLGWCRGDTEENVRENFRILGEAVGFVPEDIVVSKQIHSDRVERVGRADRDSHFRHTSRERDGIVTNEPGVALTAYGADCPTMLLYDPVHRAVAAVHSGWRGTAAGIAARAVEKLTAEYGANPAELRAAIGPCIGRCCFETHREVPDAMLKALGADALPAIDREEDGAPYGPDVHFHVDLKRINEIWLRRAGVTEIDVCPDCTACQPERFWSHRRTGGHRGSQAAIITLK